MTFTFDSHQADGVIEPLWVQTGPGLDIWKTAPLPLLIAHIVEHDHLDVRVAMGRVETLTECHRPTGHCTLWASHQEAHE